MQDRVFALDGVTPPPTAFSAVITMRQDAFLRNNLNDVILVQFVGQTNRQQTTIDGLVFNAICLPTACDNIVRTTLVASNADTSTRLLLPVDFADTVFDADEVPPIILAHTFMFNEISLAQPGSPRPFYTDLESCVSAANTTAAVAADYFSFRVAMDTELLSPGTGDQCFLKVLIMDCFGPNEVTVTSINPITGVIDRTTVTPVGQLDPVPTVMTTEPFTTDGMTTGGGGFATDSTTDGATTEDEMATEGSGATTDDATEETTTEATTEVTTETTTQDTTVETATMGPFMCGSTTATMRGACLSYLCGDNVRVLVAPTLDPDSQVAPGDFCTVSSRSVLLEGSPFTTTRVDQLNIFSEVNPGQDDLGLALLTNDFNNPDLGLYSDAANGEMPTGEALGRCNAGLGPMSTSNVIDLTRGATATFSCF